ncbi:hypothetical protein HanXRQr2_Chr01g0038381 [Helianthus annuus]|uniref:Uncharacterized protein n=1 Tax=Helianthus annuus TaxID=4232 RepID=A0A9K3JYA7_HELAN|nr:hypothetical protein HanXRQr2_Chr01g0038381 [Helianthus annuus]
MEPHFELNPTDQINGGGEVNRWLWWINRVSAVGVVIVMRGESVVMVTKLNRW